MLGLKLTQPVILALATAIGAFGGLPAPPKIFTTLSSFWLVQWFLLFVLIYQGGGGADLTFSATMTGVVFIVYHLLKVFDMGSFKNNLDDLVV